MKRGPRPGSHFTSSDGSWTDEPRGRAAGEAARRFQRELQSERRLAAAWAERDAMLDGEEERVTGEAAGKTFTCKQCGATFATQQALGGHATSHGRAGSRPRARHAGKPRRAVAGPRFRCRHCGKGFEVLHAISAHVRAAHAGRVPQRGASSGPEQIPCPMCAHPLPPGAAVVAKEFIRQGVDEEQAARLTAIACGLLHIPGRPS